MPLPVPPPNVLATPPVRTSVSAVPVLVNGETNPAPIVAVSLAFVT